VTVVMSNPWLAGGGADEEPLSVPMPDRTPLRRRAPALPQTGTVTSPTGVGLPRHQPSPDAGSNPWWWLGCHGGAGVSTIDMLVSGGTDANRGWPIPTEGTGQARVILIARTHASGLTAAQNAVRQWAAGGAPGVVLLGLVAVADAPGRLAKPLRHLLQLVSGGFPRVWLIPWVEPWRLGEPPSSTGVPREVEKLAVDLSSLKAGRLGRTS
jgi:hypothetical protein